MPYYIYRCGRGHLTEQRGGYDESIVSCACGGPAYRQAVYHEQTVITETGHVSGASDRRRRDHMGEKLNRLRKSSVETKRQMGTNSGPIKVRDWDR